LRTLVKLVKEVRTGEANEVRAFNLIKEALEKYGFFIKRNVYTIHGDEIDLLLIHKHVGITLAEIKSYFEPKEFRIWVRELMENRNKFLDYLDTNGLRGKVWVNTAIILPSTSRQEFTNHFPEADFVIYKEDLEDERKLYNKILNLPKALKRFLNISDEDLKTSLKYFFEEYEYRFTISPEGILTLLDDLQYKLIDRQTGIFNGYKLIRGGAGSGKTWVILNALIKNKNYIVNQNKRILLVCFNLRLEEFFRQQISSYGLENHVMVSRIPIDGNFRLKIKNFEKLIKLKDFDYVLCDEVQDFPKGTVRLLIENFKNVALFCDEAQRIYTQSKWTWDEELGSKFSGVEKIFLPYIYRSFTNAFKAGAEILSKDKYIKSVYKDYIDKVLKAEVLNNNGKIILVKNFSDAIDVLKEEKYSKKGILVSSDTDRIKKFLPFDADVDTYLRVKGLEYDSVVLKNFFGFLQFTALKNEELLYTRAYTFLTRSRRKIIVEKPKNITNSKVKEIYEIVEKYAEEV